MTLEAGIQLRLGSLQMDLALTAKAGVVIAVMGPNGAGKTTLLRVLAGLQALEAGRLVLNGRVVDEPDSGVFLPPERREVGMLFQDHLLFPHLSVAENVAFGPRSRGHGQSQSRAAAERWLERVGMSELAGDRPSALSGGQAQRVALARALATDPRLLLLDEPLTALDASTRVEVRRLLRDVLADYEGVAVMVTHDPVEAAALADEVIVIEAGQIAQRGTLAEITARPRSRYVADLAGLNVWRGVARGTEIRIGDAVFHAAGPTEGEVFALLQPKAVSLHLERPAGSPRNVWPGRVVSLDQAGDRIRVTVEGAATVVAEVTPGAMVELGIAGGEEVWVAFKASELEVYPA